MLQKQYDNKGWLWMNGIVLNEMLYQKNQAFLLIDNSKINETYIITSMVDDNGQIPYRNNFTTIEPNRKKRKNITDLGLQRFLLSLVSRHVINIYDSRSYVIPNIYPFNLTVSKCYMRKFGHKLDRK